MGKYDLRIVLDRADRTYKPGERITGRIEVDAHEDCECKALWVYRRWSASSGGLGDTGNAGEQNLFAGPWRAGQQAAYPFEFAAPQGPFTYNGRMFSVRWIISASAQVALINPVTEEPFRLVAGESPETDRPDKAPSAREPIRQTVKVQGAQPHGFVAFVWVVTLVVGVPALALGLMDVLPWFLPIRIPFPLPRIMPFPAPPFATLFVGVVLTLLGWRGVKRSLRPFLAGTKLGPVEVELSSNVARPGDTISCTVQFQPRANIDLSEATAKLLATEHVVVRGDTDEPDRHEQYVVTQSTATLSSERTLPAGGNLVLQANLALPADAPYSFTESSNKLLWTVRVELKLRGWPDWTCDVPVTVRP